MRHKLLYIGCLVLSFALLAMSPGQEEEPPPFEQIGVINDIFLNQRQIVIYDRVFDFPQDTPVYRYQEKIDNSNPDLRQSVSQHVLKPGMRIGYTALYNRNSGYGRAVQEVWVLPRGKFSSLE